MIFKEAMNYDEVPFGREMDAIIGEKVMGDKINCHPYRGWEQEEQYDQHIQFDSVPNYSTSISDSWKVVEKMQRHTKGCSVNLLNMSIHFRADGMGFYECYFHHFTEEWHVHAKADTAPLAICRAALKAVGK